MLSSEMRSGFEGRVRAGTGFLLSGLFQFATRSQPATVHSFIESLTLGDAAGRDPPYAYFTPSQGSANRSASGGVLGAMARPASANPGLFTVSPPHSA